MTDMGSFAVLGMIWVDNVSWLWISGVWPTAIGNESGRYTRDFWSRALFCIMRSKVVQINGVSLLMGPGEMAGWWILSPESSSVFCLSDLHQGEPKGSHWKVIEPLFDGCWHKSFLVVLISSLLLTFPPLNVTLGARDMENSPGSGTWEAASLNNL